MNLPIILSWNWSFTLLIADLFLVATYGWITRFKNTRKTFWFIFGLLLIAFALALPLGPTPPGFQNIGAFSCALPGGTLFSLHMVRHIILLMLAPPMLVAGLPESLTRKFLSQPVIRSVAKNLLNPFVTLPLGVGIMWFWHVPGIFNYLTTYGSGFGHLIIPYIEIASLLGIGMIYCWPVLSPLPEYRLMPLKGVMYLFLACFGCSILGIMITFASPGFYHTIFSSGVSTAWGFTQQTDQQAGGLLMWVPGCFIYLSGVMILLVRWFSVRGPAPRSTPKKTATI